MVKPSKIFGIQTELVPIVAVVSGGLALSAGILIHNSLHSSDVVWNKHNPVPFLDWKRQYRLKDQPREH
jgi:hypothetical protein